MNRILKKALAFVLVLAFVLSAIGAVEATQSRYENYSKNFTLTGNGATDIVNVAVAQLGKTKANLGYTEPWCADFVGDCAKLAGVSEAVPLQGGVSYLKNAVINAGGKVVTSRQKGDLVFYYCKSCAAWPHVGIVLDSEYSIEGNVSGQVYKVGGYAQYKDQNEHTVSSGTITKTYVRPNYSNTVHTHNYNTYAYFGAVHPHHSYYSCSCGDTKVNYDTTNYYASCVQCNPSAFCANIGDEFYGVILNSACWKPISKTDGTDNITLEKETGTSKQKWKFVRQSDGAYVITSCCDGTALEMTDGKRTSDTQLSAKDGYWGGYYQQWYLIPQGSGFVFLSKHYSSEQWVMDLFENNTSDGNSITIQPRNNTDAQIWNVYSKSEVQLRPADFSVTVDQDKATFKWNAIYGALGYDVKIYNDDVYMNKVDVESGYSIELPAGTYSAYVDSRDYYNYVMSNVVTFTISDKIPEKPVITSVTSNDNGMVTVRWTECEKAQAYSLRFYKSGEHYKSLIGVAKDTVYWYELPNGTYTVKVTAEGDGYWKDSEMSGEFTVEQKIPEEPAFSATCTQCGKVFDNSDAYNSHIAGHATENPSYNFTMKIRIPSITTISYGDSIILHADVTGTLPAGASIKWEASNGNFAMDVSSDGTTCKISPKSSGDTTFTATVYDEKGNVIGSDTQTMTSKAGFFDKIIAFFKKLFGLTKVIQQSLNTIY